ALLLATACQPAAPASPPAEPTAVVQATTAARPAAAATQAPPLQQPTTAPQPGVAPPTAQPKPTPLPFLPTSTLSSLPDQQRAQVKSVQSALAAGDPARALTLLQALPSDAQPEIKLLLGQAQLGDHQLDAALQTADQLITSTSNRQDLQSA